MFDFFEFSGLFIQALAKAHWQWLGGGERKIYSLLKHLISQA